jgi:hypothetical protein
MHPARVDPSLWKLLVFPCVRTLITIDTWNKMLRPAKLDTNGKPRIGLVEIRGWRGLAVAHFSIPLVLLCSKWRAIASLILLDDYISPQCSLAEELQGLVAFEMWRGHFSSVAYRCYPLLIDLLCQMYERSRTSTSLKFANAVETTSFYVIIIIIIGSTTL